MAFCDSCGRPAGLRCAGCGDSRYCSEQCQKKDWSFHKHLCKSFKDFQTKPTSDSPDLSYSRAILFHPEENAPRFVWLSFLKESCGLSADTRKWLADANEGHFMRQSSDITQNNITGRSMPYTIRVTCRENFMGDGSKPNKSVRKVSDATAQLHDWRGPLIAHGQEQCLSDFDYDTHLAVDLKPSDLPNIINWFNTYLSRQRSNTSLLQALATVTLNPPQQQQQDNDPQNTIVAVRLNCIGDVYVDRLQSFESIKIPADHAIFKQDVLPLPERLGLPIVMQRIPDSMAKWNSHGLIDGMPPWTNPTATGLLLLLDPNLAYCWMTDEVGQMVVSGFGTPPMEWVNNTGSVVAARRDRKRLRPDHVYALVEYSHGLDRDFEDAFLGKKEKRDVLRKLTKENFEKYWAGWRNQHGSFTVSPYDM